MRSQGTENFAVASSVTNLFDRIAAARVVSQRLTSSTLPAILSARTVIEATANRFSQCRWAAFGQHEYLSHKALRH